jgi:hypothetical protein
MNYLMGLAPRTFRPLIIISIIIIIIITQLSKTALDGARVDLACEDHGCRDGRCARWRGNINTHTLVEGLFCFRRPL